MDVYFGRPIWRASVSVKFRLVGLDIVMRRLIVFELNPLISDLVLWSIRCGKIIAAFLATLEFGIISTNDSSCWFSNPMR